MCQQEIAHVGRPAFQHLRHQVARHGAFAAGELGDEPLGIRVSGHRDDGQAQPGRPALGPFVESRRSLVGQEDAARPDHWRVSSGEKRRSPARISIGAFEPEPVQPDLRDLPRGEREWSVGGNPSGSARADAARAPTGARGDRRSPARPAHRARAGRAAPGQRRPRPRTQASRRRARSPRRRPIRQRVDDRGPGALRVPLVALDGDPRGPALGDVEASHERSSVNLPLPAGADRTTTWPGPAPDSRSESERRTTIPERPTDGRGFVKGNDTSQTAIRRRASDVTLAAGRHPRKPGFAVSPPGFPRRRVAGHRRRSGPGSARQHRITRTA